MNSGGSQNGQEKLKVNRSYQKTDAITSVLRSARNSRVIFHLAKPARCFATV